MLSQIPVNESDQMCALLATTERVVRISSRGQLYEQVYLPTAPGVKMQTIHRQLEEALLKLYSISLELLADSGNLLEKNTLERTLNSIVKPGEYQSQLSGLKEAEDELLLIVQACEVQRSADADDTMIDMLKTFNDPILSIDEGVSHLLTHMDERARIEMLEWISSIPFGSDHDGISEDRTPGTGEWLVQHRDFQSWESTNKSRLFWLKGSPGTGKTYLTSAVIDRIRDRVATKNEGFAFFYCHRGNDERRSQPQSVLQSLVRQLSTNTHSPESVQTKLRDAVKDAREKSTNFRLQQCRELIMASLNLYARSTLVIDALDECNPESRDELTESLDWFVRHSQKPVRIFVSSRPDPSILSQLSSGPTIDIQASDNRDDIRKYLDLEIDRVAKKVKALEKMKPEVMETLLERSQGMFQWAVLQVHQISVRCQSPGSIRDRLRTLPETLKGTYEEVWAQINDLEKQDRTLVMRAFFWARAAFKPLTSDEMLAAIRIAPNGDMVPVDENLDEDGLLSLCGRFLVVDSQLQVWRFSHLSVPEYLESEGYSPLYQAHSHAARVSLSYFINAYKEHDMQEEPKLDDKEEDVPSAFESDNGLSKLHPFHIYMRQCWMQHIQKLEGTEAAAEVTPLLKAFLGSPGETSEQYKRWYRQTTQDYDHFMFKSAFDYYRQRHFDNEELRDLLDELDPEDVGVFAMCRFSFDTILSDWWEDANLDISQVNKRGHNMLAIAARAGSLPICKWLVNKGIDVNSRMQGSNHGSALVAAAAKGHTDVVKFLVESGAEVNMMLFDKEGRFDNALAAAIDSGSLEATKYLVQKAGADINLPLPRSPYGFALGKAANTRGIGMMKIILDAGADVNMQFHARYEETALVIKIRNGELDAVKYLVKSAKADVNLLLRHHFGNALEAAVSRRDLSIARWLINEAGANLNVQSTSGIYGSPLAAACYHDVEEVEFLVTAGADINVPLLIGEHGSALAVGCAIGGIDVVRCLLSAGADPNMRLERGIFGSALAAAAYEAIGVELVQALVEGGAEINAQLEAGEFGCALAAAGVGGETGDSDVFPYLVEAGADVNMKLKYGVFGTPFAATVWGRQFEKIQLLVDKGADINMPLGDNDFCNPLALVAAFTWGEGTVEFIIELGVDVNPKHGGKRYGSPLIAAAAFNQTECVEYLIQQGADVNQRFESSYYTTALQAAEAEFPREDRDWMLRFFGGEEDDIEELVEEWGEEKSRVIEVLREHGATG